MNIVQHNQNRWVIDELKKIPNCSRLLDVGAGGCRYKEWCGHLHYESHDFCKVEEQERAFDYREHDYVCDILDIPEEGDKYDVILCTMVLEHVPYPAETVMKFSVLLKTGGKLILVAPLMSGLHQKPYHFYGGFTPYWYEHFLGKAGFYDIKCEPSGGFFYFYAQQTMRASTFIRTGREIKPVARYFAMLAVPFLRFVMAPAMRFLDPKIEKPDFPAAFFVSALKR